MSKVACTVPHIDDILTGKKELYLSGTLDEKLQINKNGKFMAECDDDIIMMITNDDVRSIRTIIESKNSINHPIGSLAINPIVYCFFGVAHNQSNIRMNVLLNMIKIKNIELNFPVRFRDIVSNFLDLIVNVVANTGIIGLLVSKGAIVADRKNIPHNLPIGNAAFVSYLIGPIYDADCYCVSGIEKVKLISKITETNPAAYSHYFDSLQINMDNLHQKTRLILMTYLPNTLGSKLSLKIMSPNFQIIVDKSSLPNSVNIDVSLLMERLAYYKTSGNNEIKINTKDLLIWLMLRIPSRSISSSISQLGMEYPPKSERPLCDNNYWMTELIESFRKDVTKYVKIDKKIVTLYLDLIK